MCRLLQAAAVGESYESSTLKLDTVDVQKHFRLMITCRPEVSMPFQDKRQKLDPTLPNPTLPNPEVEPYAHLHAALQLVLADMTIRLQGH